MKGLLPEEGDSDSDEESGSEAPSSTAGALSEALQWALMTHKGGRAPVITSPILRQDVASPNPFGALSSDGDADDDESEVLAALQQLSSKITGGPKPSQKTRKET